MAGEKGKSGGAGVARRPQALGQDVMSIVRRPDDFSRLDGGIDEPQVRHRAWQNGRGIARTPTETILLLVRGEAS